MPEPLADPLERALAKEYLAAMGDVGQVPLDIHPSDDMYTVMVGHPDYRPHTRGFYYFKSGHDVLVTLEHLIGRLGKRWSDFEAILELACGYGRFTRLLSKVVPPERITSVDILEDAPRWVSSHYGVEGRLSATEPSEVDLGRSFDLIFVGSLFSHLPRPRFESWLARLIEMLTPCGVLAFSTHGEALLDEGARDASGFTFQPHSESDVLDPGEYGSTFVRPSLVRELAANRGAKSVFHRRRELWNFQDLFAVSPTEIDLGDWGPAPVVRGRIDQLQVESDGRFWIAGWAADLSGAPIEKVALSIDGQPTIEIPIDQARPDVAETLERPDLLKSGWQLEGRVPPLPPGAHRLVASLHSETLSGRPFDAMVFGES
ncbi:MAG: methyltransferase domain-containing protein [Planctomycetota bacterium]